MVMLVVLAIVQYRDTFFQLQMMATKPRSNEYRSIAPSIIRGPPVIDGNETKRHLVFHMGPPKTGSTTIQCLLREHESTLLVQDRYSLVETENCRPKKKGKAAKLKVSPLTGNGYLPRCLEMVESYPSPDCWVEYLQVINQHYDDGNHVIISNENIAVVKRKNASNLETSFLDVIIEDLSGRFEIHFVAVYRHYFDWIASFYNQQFKQIWTKPGRFGAWPGTTKRAMVIPRTIDYALAAVANGQRGELDQWIPLYKSKANNIRFTILDMHHGDEESTSQSSLTPSASTLEMDFFCNTVPEMQEMCKHLSSVNLQEKRKNPASGGVVTYDRLTTAAYARGWIHPKVSRRTAFLLARSFGQKMRNISSTADFPLICPTKEQLQVLWDRSLLYAQHIFPLVEHAPDNIEDHVQRGLDRAVNEHTLCDVDSKRLLAEQHWEEFFKGIRPDSRPEDEQ
jgi:hypothetical protein